MTARRLALLLLALLAASTPLLAAEEGRYVVTLDAAAAVDRTEAIATELAAAYGGTLDDARSTIENEVVLRIPPSRLAALQSDPRVKAVVRLRSAANAVVEPVSWSAGVPYSYDGAGNIASIGSGSSAYDFLYDDVGRLVRAKINGVTRSYDYDAFGNRKDCAQSDGTACDFGYGATSSNNHLTGNVTYDSAGSGRVTALGTHNYAYDSAEMMTRDNTSEYLYTALDERIATHDTAGGSWRWTIRDGSGRILRELSANDSGGTIGASTWKWVRDYVWRDALLLASRQKEGTLLTTYHYHLDHLGTPRRITDGNDDVIGFHDYYAFGPEVFGGLNEPSRSLLRYAGQERDGSDEPYGLDYLHARFYDPSLGRFLSLDREIGRVAFPQSWNRYTYALNNPLRLFDPSGNAPKESQILHVRVNIIFSNADHTNPIFAPKSLRARTEEGIVKARQHYAEMGIAVDIQRYEGTLLPNDKGQVGGVVNTPGGPVFIQDFITSQAGHALTVMATPDFENALVSASGGTKIVKGVPLWTILGAGSNWKTLEHEMAHAFGNTIGDNSGFFANAITDFVWFAERTQHDWNPPFGLPPVGFSYDFELKLREGAAKVSQNGQQ